MPKIKIHTFGEGIEIRQLQLDPLTLEHWYAIAAKKNRPLHELLLDPFFYYNLKHKKIKQLSDIDATLITGMQNSYKSQIEIWFKRRKVLKIKAHELFNEMLLFPLFRSEKGDSFLSNDLEKGFYVVQKTIGLLRIEQLEVNLHHLNIEDFNFIWNEFESDRFLTAITFQNQNLNYLKSDTIITYQNAFEIL